MASILPDCPALKNTPQAGNAPAHIDVEIVAEFEHIKNWTNENKMMLNMSKTKEIVFRRPCPVRFHLSP